MFDFHNTFKIYRLYNAATAEVKTSNLWFGSGVMAVVPELSSR